MRADFLVRNAGLMTTCQDLGRPGFAALGVSESGAIDAWALRVGNRLAGNPEGAAALEMTLVGATLEVAEGEAVVALAGADMEPRLNGVRVPLWTALRVKKGDVIACGAAKEGCRAYLCISGGVDAPLVMGSRSTDTLGGFGGLHGGRPLRPGDQVPGGEGDGEPGRSLPPPFVPDYPEEAAVRCVLGPQDDHFTAAGVATFLGSLYRVSPQSNRQGARLDGPPVEHRAAADIISDGMPLGGVQVPRGGHPIVMLAGRQTAGGYAKIATVISPDVARIGQLRPGERARFTALDVEGAQGAARQAAEHLDRVREALQAPVPAAHRFLVTVRGRRFDVTVTEVQP